MCEVINYKATDVYLCVGVRCEGVRVGPGFWIMIHDHLCCTHT